MMIGKTMKRRLTEEEKAEVLKYLQESPKMGIDDVTKEIVTL